ncbi:MAG: deaminase [Candidatus Thorarchaeota archaeon]|jgi:dCMP deaminase
MNELEKLKKWDKWYFDVCNVVASNSKCLSRKIGAILVRDKAIVSQGYCGPPRGVRPCDERWRTDKKMREAVDFDAFTEDFFVMHLKGVCPRYIPEMGFKSGEGLEWCVSGHAERNALINAARFGIKTKGTIMYMSCAIPCTPCLVEIVNAGVEEIVVMDETYYDVSAKYLLKESGLKWRIFSHLKQ